MFAKNNHVTWKKRCLCDSSRSGFPKQQHWLTVSVEAGYTNALLSYCLVIKAYKKLHVLNWKWGIWPPYYREWYTCKWYVVEIRMWNLTTSQATNEKKKLFPSKIGKGTFIAVSQMVYCIYLGWGSQIKVTYSIYANETGAFRAINAVSVAHLRLNHTHSYTQVSGEAETFEQSLPADDLIAKPVLVNV